MRVIRRSLSTTQFHHRHPPARTSPWWRATLSPACPTSTPSRASTWCPTCKRPRPFPRPPTARTSRCTTRASPWSSPTPPAQATDLPRWWGTSRPTLSVKRVTLLQAQLRPPPPSLRTRSPPTALGTTWAAASTTCSCTRTPRAWTCLPTKIGSAAVLRRSRLRTGIGRTSRTWWVSASPSEPRTLLHAFQRAPSLPNFHPNQTVTTFALAFASMCFCICRKYLHYPVCPGW